MERAQVSILVCDDSEISCLGITSALTQDEHCRVVGIAHDGMNAVQTALELKPDVVLMDIQMPVMNGIEATKRIKLASRSIKVLMLTSATDDDTIMAAFSSGADGYCLKGSPVSHMVQAIFSTASGASWLDPGIAMRVLRNSGRDGTASSISIAKRGLKDEKFRLSSREIEVLHYLVQGMSNRQIAEQLSVSPETVKTHLRHVMEKLMVADRTQAAVKAVNEGLVGNTGT